MGRRTDHGRHGVARGSAVRDQRRQSATGDRPIPAPTWQRGWPAGRRRLRVEATAAALDAILIAGGYCFVMLVRTLGEATPTPVGGPAALPPVGRRRSRWCRLGASGSTPRSGGTPASPRPAGCSSPAWSAPPLVTVCLARRRPAVPAQRERLRRDGGHHAARRHPVPVPAVRLQPARQTEPRGYPRRRARCRRGRSRAGPQHAARPARRAGAGGDARRRPAQARPRLRGRAGWRRPSPTWPTGRARTRPAPGDPRRPERRAR